MAMVAQLDADARRTIEEQLSEVDGVLHASIDARTNEIWIARDPGHEHGPIELAVRNRLAGLLGHDAAGLAVRVTLPTPAGPRRRVRFVGVRRQEEGGRVTVAVDLEWNDVTHSGDATGEKGPAVELKTAAHAAVRALEKVSNQPLDVRVIGVKPIHAFDSDLMVASLLRSDDGQQRLVGAVVVAEDPLGAAAVAVLSALNRTLGNFLHTAD